MLKANRGSALRRESPAAERIPYSAHVCESVIKTKFGDYLQVFRLAGASFGTADDAQLNAWYERLNALWRDVASPTVALWTHVIRRRDRTQYRDTAARGFAADLARQYYERLATQTLMVNELYLSVIYRPSLGAATGAISRALSRGRRHGSRIDLADALDTCAQLARTLQASLARYEPQILRTYRAGPLGARPFSSSSGC